VDAGFSTLPFCSWESRSKAMSEMNPRTATQDRMAHSSSAAGAIMVELALSIFIFFLMLSGIIDFGNLMRERAVLSAATHAGVMAVVHYPAWDPTTLQKAAYSSARMREGRNMAAQYVARQGLNYRDYMYWSWLRRQGAGVPSNQDPTWTQDWHPVISVTIRRRASGGYIILPSFVVGSCVASRALASGTWHRNFYNRGFYWPDNTSDCL
jgi:hypothetical protein